MLNLARMNKLANLLALSGALLDLIRFFLYIPNVHTSYSVSIGILSLILPALMAVISVLRHKPKLMWGAFILSMGNSTLLMIFKDYKFYMLSQINLILYGVIVLMFTIINNKQLHSK